jgi:hypothetical protein
LATGFDAGVGLETGFGAGFGLGAGVGAAFGLGAGIGAGVGAGSGVGTDVVVGADSSVVVSTTFARADGEANASRIPEPAVKTTPIANNASRRRGRFSPNTPLPSPGRKATA